MDNWSQWLEHDGIYVPIKINEWDNFCALYQYAFDALHGFPETVVAVDLMPCSWNVPCCFIVGEDI